MMITVFQQAVQILLLKAIDVFMCAKRHLWYIKPFSFSWGGADWGGFTDNYHTPVHVYF